MNIIEFTDEIGNENIIIENEDGSTISMLKSVYDEQQANQSFAPNHANVSGGA